ncbi:MAG: hypothetical protein ACYCO3_02500 [Mycobacteriales bacterium]
MCGPNSALGLEQAERAVWPQLRERLRSPGDLMALMRGVLGGDTEVAVVAAVNPTGMVKPLALIVTPGIAAELSLIDHDPGEEVSQASIGPYPVEALVAHGGGGGPIAVLVNPWIRQHLYLYANQLWHRPRRPPADSG